MAWFEVPFTVRILVEADRDAEASDVGEFVLIKHFEGVRDYEVGEVKPVADPETWD